VEINLKVRVDVAKIDLKVRVEVAMLI